VDVSFLWETGRSRGRLPALRRYNEGAMGAACSTAAIDSALPAADGGAAVEGAANPCAAIIACTFAPYSSSIRLQG
jgi:hypothetical protein